MESSAVGNIVFTYTSVVSEVLDNVVLEKMEYLEEPQRFYYTLLHKLRNILDAASFLVTNLDRKPHYTDSAYLLLRTCLLDAACLYFVLDMSENKVEQDARIERIMYDHVRSIYTCARDEDERLLVRTKFPNCFTGVKFRKDIAGVSIKAMHDEIKIKSLQKEVGYAISLYNIFSKVEHNGILSFNLLHDHFSEEGGVRSKRKIYDALGTIMLVINLLIAKNWVPVDDTRYQRLIGFTKQIIAIKL